MVVAHLHSMQYYLHVLQYLKWDGEKRNVKWFFTFYFLPMPRELPYFHTSIKSDDVSRIEILIICWIAETFKIEQKERRSKINV